jgi:DNA invertase Pin-like site-specific DNA recombinase
MAKGRPAATRAAIYVRVSTKEQTVRNQERELKIIAAQNGWSIVAVFKDEGVSGITKHRPGLKKLLEGVGRRDFTRVLVWSADRLGRSVPHLVRVLEEFKAKGVHLYCKREGIDTTTPMGEAFYYNAGIWADIERRMIVDRVKAGISRAQKEGTKSGRPFGRPRIDPAITEKIREHLEAGQLGVHKIAKLVGVGSSTVQRLNDERRGRVT